MFVSSNIGFIDLIIWLIFGFTAIQFFIAFFNMLYIDKLPSYSNEHSLVSILLPARNEEKNIRDFITSIENQDYKEYELIICNDNSTDNTLRIAHEAMQNNARIKIMEAGDIPEGWLGKNYACYKLAQHAQGKYLLFLDADVRISGNIIQKAVEFMNRKSITLLSIFPNQSTVTNAEKATVPVMFQILLSLLPLVLVRISSRISLSAANGQFMLFESKIYNQLQPHEVVKNIKAEDIAISRLMKKKKLKMSCHAGEKLVTCRMYENYADAVSGFSKNISAMFGNSICMAFIFWFLSTFGVAFFMLWMNTIYSVLLLAIIIFTNIFIAKKTHQNIFEKMLFYIPQQISLGVFIYKHIVCKLTGNYRWKGRNV